VRALERLAARLRDEGGLLAGAVVDPPTDPGADLAVEAIREGYLLHYGEARLLAPGDADLGLLAGDRLYALGLAELAAAGDLDGVRLMARVIGEAAAAQAAGEADRASAVWEMAHTARPPAHTDR
jgi:hypothetical protein